MELVRLLDVLKTANIELRIKDGRLSVRDPNKALSNDLLAQVSNRKTEIMRFLSSRGRTSASIKPVEDCEYYPLSHSQQFMWNVDRTQSNPTAYIVPGRIDFDAKLNLQHCVTAVSMLLERHTILRTIFAEVEALPVQKILPTIPICNVVDCYEFDNAYNLQEAIHKKEIETFSQPFDLQHGPLIRLKILVAPDCSSFLYALHHIIADAASMEVFRQELIELYDNVANGKRTPISDLDFHYKDYAVQQSHESTKENLAVSRAYWENVFSGDIPKLNFPIGARETNPSGRRAQQLKVPIEIGAFAALKSICTGHETTHFIGIVAIINVLLSRYCNQYDIIIGTPVSARESLVMRHQLGMYLNTIPLRNTFSAETTFGNLVRQVKQAVASALAHRDYPIQMLIDDLRPKGSSANALDFPVFVAYERMNDPSRHDQHKPAHREQVWRRWKYPIQIIIEDFGDRADMTIEYSSDRYEREWVGHVASNLQLLMTAASRNLDLPIGKLPIINGFELRLLTHALDAGGFDAKCLQGGILDSIRQQNIIRPDAIAILCRGNAVTYRMLDNLSDDVAWKISTTAVRRDTWFVAIDIDDNEWMIVGILGIWKAGKAYLPIGKKLPSTRRDFIIKEAGVELIISFKPDTEYQGLDGKLTLINPSLVERVLDKFPATRSDSSAPAYVMFTSGTTGVPKGVVVNHKALYNVVQHYMNTLKVDSNLRVFSATEFTFDISVLEFMLPLTCGGCLYLYRNSVLDVAQMATEIKTSSPNFIQATPSIWSMILDQSDLDLTGVVAMSGGEFLDQNIQDRLVNSTSELWNNYGPTETTIWSTAKRVTSQDHAGTVGFPIANTAIFILDGFNNVLPFLAEGEICISGTGLANGYLNSPELTSSRFIRPPFLEDTLVYKTGDIGRRYLSGEIEIIGRIDEQVKINGNRIELGEIESVIGHYNLVKQCKVIVEVHPDKTRFLTAYLVVQNGFDQAKLITLIKDRLPNYMLPGRYKVIETIPLNTSGKISRSQLQTMPLVQEFNVTAMLPRNSVEARLAEVFEELLNTRVDNIFDQFMYIGGTSIKVIKLATRIKQVFNVTIGAGNLFENASIAHIANVIKTSKGENSEEASWYEEQDTYPLSDGQQQVWVAHELSFDKRAFNLPLQATIQGDLNVAKLNTAFDVIVQRHEILRTRFVLRDEKLRQSVQPFSTECYAFETLELLDDAHFPKLLLIETNRLFDLENGPVFYVKAVRRRSDTVLLITTHHIVFDALSTTVMLTELFDAYKQIENGKIFVEPVHQYRNFAMKQRLALDNDQVQHAMAFWTEQLADPPKPARITPDINTGGTPRGDSFDFDIKSTVVESINALGQQSKVTRFIVVLSLVKALVYRYTGETDVTIGTPVNVRANLAMEKSIGMYVNILPIRYRFSGNDEFRFFLAGVNKVFLEYLDNSSYPVGGLKDDLARQTSQTRERMDIPFSICVQYQEYTQTERNNDIRGFQFDEVRAIESNVSKYDIRFSFVEHPNGIFLSIEYRSDLYSRDRILNIVSDLERSTMAFLYNPQMKLCEIEGEYDSEEQREMAQFLARAKGI